MPLPLSEVPVRSGIEYPIEQHRTLTACLSMFACVRGSAGCGFDRWFRGFEPRTEIHRALVRRWSRGSRTEGCEGEQVGCAESDGVSTSGAGDGDSYPGKVIRQKSGRVQWRVDTGANVSSAHAVPVAVYKHCEADARGPLLETHRNVRRPHDGLGTRRGHARGEMACCGSGPNPVDGR